MPDEEMAAAKDNDEEESRAPGLKTLRIPLKGERWQRDLITKRMELCRSIYNAELDNSYRRYNEMVADPRYAGPRSVIDEVYTHKGEERDRAKDTPEYKKAIKEQGALYREYGFTGYSFNERAIAASKQYSNVLPTRVAHFTVGMPLWRAWQQYLTGRRRGIAYRAHGNWNILTSDGRSGIRLVGPDNKAVRDGIVLTGSRGAVTREGTVYDAFHLYVVYGRTTGRRVLRLPLYVPKKDPYTIEGLSRPMHTISVVRILHHGHWKLYAQLTVEE